MCMALNSRLSGHGQGLACPFRDKGKDLSSTCQPLSVVLGFIMSFSVGEKGPECIKKESTLVVFCFVPGFQPGCL